MAYPLVPPPLSDTAAFNWPRRLQRWLDDNPAGPLTRISTFIVLQPFNEGTTAWLGVSNIIFAFNFESPNGFSLKSFTPPTNPNYTLCISFHVGGVMYRYSLWRNPTDVMPGNIPAYTNQPILKNFRLEVWNIPGEVPAIESNGFTFYTSKLGGIDYRYGSDAALANPDPIVSNFECLPMFSNATEPWTGLQDVLFQGKFLSAGAIAGSAQGGGTLTTAGTLNNIAGSYVVRYNGNTQATINNETWTTLFCAFNLNTPSPHDNVSFGSYATSSFVGLLTIEVTQGGTTEVVVNGADAGVGCTVILPNNTGLGCYSGVIVCVMQYSNTNHYTLYVYDINNNLLGSASSTGTTNGFVDASSTPCISIGDLFGNDWFLCCGLIQTIVNPVNLAQYILQTTGYRLPLTFPTNAVSTTN